MEFPTGVGSSPKEGNPTKLELAAHFAKASAAKFLSLLIQAKEQLELLAFDLISSNTGVSFQSGLEFPFWRASTIGLQSPSIMIRCQPLSLAREIPRPTAKSSAFMELAAVTCPTQIKSGLPLKFLAITPKWAPLVL